MAGEARPSSWIEWYRFARETLTCTHEEAVTYANLRFVEQQNRAQNYQRSRRAAPPAIA